MRFFSFVISFVHTSLSFIRQINGDKEAGEPTRTDRFGLGQDIVM